MTIKNKKKIIDRLFSNINKLPDLQMNLFFKLSDLKLKEEKKKVLKQAIENGKETAKEIANSLGLNLGKLNEINYNWKDFDGYQPIQSYTNRSYEMSSIKDNDFNNILNTEVEIFEKIYMVWFVSK